MREEAVSGEAFESLIEKYSDAAESTLSFGKGEQEAAFEEAAFNLGTDEISGVVETSEGYEIIKCISTFNREETDRNKEKIAEPEAGRGVRDRSMTPSWIPCRGI